MGQLTLILGGAASGKSAFAEALAAGAARHGTPIVYLATLAADAVDDEMAGRLAAHRDRRPADWATRESPALALDDIPPDAGLLVDSLTTHVSWLLDAHPLALQAYGAEGRAALAPLLTSALSLIDAALDRPGPTWVVSDELGLGLVPESRLGRAFRDLLGDVNQRVSAAADRAFLLVAGRPLELPQRSPLGPQPELYGP